MTRRVRLRGITWDHPRGLAPLQHTSHMWSALEPAIEVTWEARSLLQFGEEPIEELSRRFDLVVMDHPFVGLAATKGLLLPIDALVARSALRDLAKASVGPSYGSYEYDDHVWALPIDAAAQVAAFRPDLLASAGESLPASWEEALALARRLRRAGLAMAMPMIHTDLVPTFFTLATNLGEAPLAHPDRWVLGPAHLDRVLDLILQLRESAVPESPWLDPPRLFDRMTSTDEIAYCPLAFGYSNYARKGFRPNRLRFVNMPSAVRGLGGSTLGGAGIAISSMCRQPDLAARYALWLSSADIQRGPYFDGGGQPAHRSAWVDDRTNDATAGFFRDTIVTLDAASVRPRWPGYPVFQDLAGPALHRYVIDEIDRPTLVRSLEEARLASRR